MSQENHPLIRIKFEPRDLWIGVYWTISEQLYRDHSTQRTFMARKLSVYVCLIPMLPIVFRKRLGPLGPTNNL